MRISVAKAVKYISPISAWIYIRFICKEKLYGKVPDNDLIMNKIKEYILGVDKTRTKEQLDKDLKGVNIRLFELYGGDDNIEGFANPLYDDIFIHKDVYEKGKIPYKLIVHETIHKLQNLGIKHKKYLGLIEGATDSYTHKIMNIKKSSKYKKSLLNIPVGAYNHSEALFNTLNLILGEEIMQEFALKGNLKFINQFKELYGEELLKRVIDFTNKSAVIEYDNPNEEVDDFKKLQDDILNNAFERMFDSISNAEGFIDYFNKLKEFQNYRYRDIDNGDMILQNFYNTKLEKAKKILKEWGQNTSVLDTCLYENEEFYPHIDKNEIKETAKSKVFEYIYNNGITDIKIQDIKKYGFDYGDNYCVMYAIQGKPIFLQCGNLHYYSEYVEENFILKKQEEHNTFKGDRISLVQKDKEFTADFMKFSKKSGFLEMVKLQELPTDITDIEIRSVLGEYQRDLLKERYSGAIGFFRRIKDRFFTQKMLPEGKSDEEMMNTDESARRFRMSLENNVKSIGQNEVKEDKKNDLKVLEGKSDDGIEK